jgi:hypothetical protein
MENEDPEYHGKISNPFSSEENCTGVSPKNFDEGKVKLAKK